MKKQAVKQSKIGITPVGDRLVIEEIDEKTKKTDSGIYIPDTVKEDRGAKRGKVIAAGTGRYEDGDLIPMTVKTGDEVLFQWGDKVQIDGKEYFIVRESEVIAVIN
jgi:chaperonin GroES